MNETMPLGRKVLTTGVIFATVLWSMMAAVLIIPMKASAGGCTSGTLIKGPSFSAVYYCGADGKRYVFPNEKTFFTWYNDFSGVVTISDQALAEIAIGGNVTYRPGALLVKIQSDPRTYVVSKGGVLRWIKTEGIAACLYGSGWTNQVHDVPDSFFVNYTVGTDVNVCADFDRPGQLAAALSINTDLGLTIGGGGSASLVISGSFPSSGETNVSAGTNVSATFSQSIDASTATTGTFTLTSASSGAVSGAVSVNGNTVTFNPSADLMADVTYTARITTGLMTQSGESLSSDHVWSFTVAGSASAAPTVSSVAPGAGSLNVDVDADVTATFSETMSASTLNTSTFTLFKGSTQVSGAVSYSGNTATFNPSADLEAGATYTATITTGAKDSNDNGLAANYAWQFTVAAGL